MLDAGVPAMQATATMIASLPKKAGGYRTVAVAPTLYRITMQMDNALIQKFEDDHPDDNDSARRGT